MVKNQRKSLTNSLLATASSRNVKFNSFTFPTNSVSMNKKQDKPSGLNLAEKEWVLLAAEVYSPMKQRALKNVNNYLNTNIYPYLETSGGQSSNPYLNAVHFFNTSVN
jgi:hypothetical protein